MRKFHGKRIIYEDNAILLCILQEEKVSEKLVVIGTGNIIDWRPMSIQKPLFKGCTVLAMYFKTRWKGLIKYYRVQGKGLGPAGKSLANFIDNSDFAKEYKRIFFVMHSKCGVMDITSLANNLKRKGTDHFMISTPYLGTPIVMPKEIKKRIFRREWFEDGSVKESFVKYILCWLEYVAYRVTYGDYPVDHDISLNSTYFKDNFKKESLEGQRFYNIVSDCSMQWEQYWREREGMEKLLYWVNERLDIFGDGVVPLYSQEHINFQGVCYKTYTMDATHIDSLKKAVPIIQKCIDKAN